MTASYAEFIERKAQGAFNFGFEPVAMPDFLFPFQRHLIDWALRKGRAAIFADCGLGKTPMQLVWADNVVRHTGRHVLILTPLAVGPQTLREADKFGIACVRSRDGMLPQRSTIVVTNYERLHLFDAAAFAGVVCDESSILKHFSGATQKAVTRFMAKVPYRLLCTATAAPNDYIELGTSSEALGELGNLTMLSRFFRQVEATSYRIGRQSKSTGFAVAGTGQRWRLKGHATMPFWRWVSSWARAIRKPSDFGFDDDGFVLPPLIERTYVVKAERPPDGMLFTLPAFGLSEERQERRRTMAERCAMVANLVAADSDCTLVWCHLNAEGDLLERLIPGAVQVAGRHSDDYKEAAIEWFVGARCICHDPLFPKRQANGVCTCGQVSGRRVLISKPVMFGWGLNLQHCAHIITFATHSFESYYQSLRRCWRFGQVRPVTVDLIASEAESRVIDNLRRKQEAADHMFAQLLTHMQDALRITAERATVNVEVPKWL